MRGLEHDGRVAAGGGSARNRRRPQRVSVMPPSLSLPSLPLPLPPLVVATCVLRWHSQSLAAGIRSKPLLSPAQRREPRQSRQRGGRARARRAELQHQLCRRPHGAVFVLPRRSARRAPLVRCCVRLPAGCSDAAAAQTTESEAQRGTSGQRTHDSDTRAATTRMLASDTFQLHEQGRTAKRSSNKSDKHGIGSVMQSVTDRPSAKPAAAITFLHPSCLLSCARGPRAKTNPPPSQRSGRAFLSRRFRFPRLLPVECLALLARSRQHDETEAGAEQRRGTDSRAEHRTTGASGCDDFARRLQSATEHDRIRARGRSRPIRMRGESLTFLLGSMLGSPLSLPR